MMPNPALAGREQEFAQLNTFLWPAIAGQGKVVFVTSRAETDSRGFVEAALTQVQSMHPNPTIAVGECRDSGRDYLPFVEILRLMTGEVYGDLEDNAVSETNAERLRGMLTNIRFEKDAVRPKSERKVYPTIAGSWTASCAFCSTTSVGSWTGTVIPPMSTMVLPFNLSWMMWLMTCSSLLI